MAHVFGEILVVEDEPEIRELMTLQLERAGYSATSVSTAEDAIYWIRKKQFDLLVLDWMLPRLSGIDVIREARKNSLNQSQPILMVTARTEPRDIVEGLEKGADDYLTKPFEVNVLLARVRALLRRVKSQAPSPAVATFADEETLTLGCLRMDLHKYQVTCGDEEIHLTPSEFKLIKTLAAFNGKVLTRDQLVQEIQGEGISVVGRTVDTHIFGLRKKLGPCADVIETVRGIGYRIKG
jgi:two-component system, OmpR family, phosphate regulon response regulator PhoB